MSLHPCSRNFDASEDVADIRNHQVRGRCWPQQASALTLKIGRIWQFVKHSLEDSNARQQSQDCPSWKLALRESTLQPRSCGRVRTEELELFLAFPPQRDARCRLYNLRNMEASGEPLSRCTPPSPPTGRINDTCSANHVDWYVQLESLRHGTIETTISEIVLRHQSGEYESKGLGGAALPKSRAEPPLCSPCCFADQAGRCDLVMGFRF